MEAIRRICFWAGPSAGKTTTASLVFAKLKEARYSVEFAKEQVKLWTYYHRKPKPWNQITLLGLQMEQEYEPLSAGVKFVVAECPLLSGAIYGRIAKLSCVPQIITICHDFEAEFPSFNIFLERGDRTFKKEGRFHTLEEAKKIDQEIKELLDDEGVPYMSFPYSAVEDIFAEVVRQVGSP